MNQLQLKALRNIAGVLLARAIQEMFPSARIFGSGADDLGFWCDCSFRKPIDAGAIEQLEERLLQLAAMRLPTQSMTMMRQNAIEMLRHQNAKSVPDVPDEPLVEMVKVGDFCAPCPLPHASNTGEISALKLFPLEEGEITRISGTCFADKKDLKNFLKLFEQYKQKGHMAVGERDGVFSVSNGNILWKEKGLHYFDEIHSLWREVTPKGAAISSPLIVEEQLRQSHIESQRVFFHEQGTFSEWGIVESFFESNRSSPLLTPTITTLGTTTVVCSATEAADVLISSLHSIEKISRMFGINAQWMWRVSKADSFRRTPRSAKDPSYTMFEALSQKAASQSKIDFAACEADMLPKHTMFVAKYRDLLGRSWEGPTIQCMPLVKGKTDGLVVIHCDLFGPVERLIALLLEGQGSLPEPTTR